MTQIWNDYVVLAGGDWSQHRTTASLVDEYEIEDEPPDLMWIGEGYLSGFDDTQGRTGQAKWKETIDWLLDLQPEWIKKEGYAYYAEMLEKHGPPPGFANGNGTTRGRLSTGAKVSKLRTDVAIQFRKTVTKEHGVWPKTDAKAQKTWRGGAVKIWKDGCKHSDLDPDGVQLQAITNIETLTKLLSYFTARAD